MDEAQTDGRGRDEASLYDIGAFLERGLNMDVAQAQDMILSLQSRMARSGLERDQDDVAEIEYDILADIVEMADRLVKMWLDDTHILVIRHPFDSPTIEHSLRCRATRAMAVCRYHLMVVDHDQRGGLPLGRSKMTLQDGDQSLAFEAMP